MGSNDQNRWASATFSTGLVSVIIPTYNRAAFLQEAVDSVIRQTYRPIECIVVDDGSTDNTKALVEEFVSENNESFRLYYIYQNNAGAQAARNTGTEASTGEFIQYLDSDDLLYPEKLEKQVYFLQNNDGCDVIFGNWRKGTSSKNELITSYAGDNLVAQFLTEHSIHTLSFLVRRNILQTTVKWDTEIKRNQEIDFQMTILMSGGRFCYLPVECGLWQIHDSARIANTTGGRDILFFFKKWERILDEKGLLTPKIKKNIAHILYSFCLHNRESIGQKGEMLIEAVRLDPDIPFINTPKMRILRRLCGTRFATNRWLLKVTGNK